MSNDKQRKPVGVIVDEETRVALFDEINRRKDIDAVARAVGVSAVTLSRCVAGRPVNKQTVILADRFVDQLVVGEDTHEDGVVDARAVLATG